MSQAKVDKYKEEKAKRQKIMRREKLKARLAGGIVAVCCAGIIAYIGFSIYDFAGSSKTISHITVDTSAVDDYQAEVY